MLDDEGIIKQNIGFRLGSYKEFLGKIANVEKYLKVSESKGLLEAQWPE